jgi:hypothetical protein
MIRTRLSEMRGVDSDAYLLAWLRDGSNRTLLKAHDWLATYITPPPLGGCVKFFDRKRICAWLQLKAPGAGLRTNLDQVQRSQEFRLPLGLANYNLFLHDIT